MQSRPQNHSRSASPIFVAISLLPEGRNPGLPAFTPDKRFLVVPNQDTDNVSIVSCAEFSVIRTIKLPDKSCPWQAKVTPDGRFAFVTNSMFSGEVSESPREDSTVSVIDLNAGTVVKHIPVGAGPNGVTVDPMGRHGYVANMRSHTVTVIDVEAQEAVATIPVGRAPAFAKLTCDGRLLVVTSFEDSSLSLIDTNEMRVIDTIQVGVPRLMDPHPEWGPGDTVGVAITRDMIAYVTNWRTHEIVVVNLSDRSVTRFASPIKYPFGIEIDAKLNVVVITSGRVRRFVILDMKNNQVLAEFPHDGTVFPTGRLAGLNHWMTDPENHRITALLPNGIDGMIKDWDRNMVSKLM